ncbi:MAG: hypothetical protein ABR584_09170 [Candidatus Baltobacteraceae bacterium]
MSSERPAILSATRAACEKLPTNSGGTFRRIGSVAAAGLPNTNNDALVIPAIT